MGRKWKGVHGDWLVRILEWPIVMGYNEMNEDEDV